VRGILTPYSRFAISTTPESGSLGDTLGGFDDGGVGPVIERGEQDPADYPNTKRS